MRCTALYSGAAPPGRQSQLRATCTAPPNASDASRSRTAAASASRSALGSAFSPALFAAAPPAPPPAVSVTTTLSSTTLVMSVTDPASSPDIVCVVVSVVACGASSSGFLNTRARRRVARCELKMPKVVAKAWSRNFGTHSTRHEQKRGAKVITGGKRSHTRAHSREYQTQTDAEREDTRGSSRWAR
jgi:hypothetical protein